MKSAYLLHGVRDHDEFVSRQYPSSSNSHWIPWLQKELVVAGYFCQTPEMPTPYAPKYEEWKDLFARFPIDENSVIVGHSAGAGFALRYLAETKQRIAHLILVAPWIDPRRIHGDFLNFQFDAALPQQVGRFDLLHSEDDFDDIVVTTKALRDTYTPAQMNYHRFTNHGHFCLEDMGTVVFPELLDLIVQK